jgi:hypothetical protein
MSFVEPPQGRAAITNDGLSLRISIPARGNLFAILFLGAWMVGWYVGETSAFREVFKPGGSPQGTFLVAWLVAWTIGGLFAALTLLWSLFGREVIELHPESLVHRRTILGIGRKKVYSVASIKDLRVTSPGLRFNNLSFSKLFDRQNQQEMPRPGDFWGLSGGPIVFDYGARTVRCGAGVDEAEAKTIVAQLTRWNRRLESTGAA